MIQTTTPQKNLCRPCALPRTPATEPPGIAEEIPGELGGEGGSDGEEVEPWLDGNPLLRHESRGHWPYDAGCGACVQARGRTPARRIHSEAEPEGLGADFLFFGNGKYWKVLILVMFASVKTNRRSRAPLKALLFSSRLEPNARQATGVPGVPR